MIKVLPVLPFAAFLALLACDRSDPVAEEAVAPADNMVGDALADGLAAPANAAAAEREEQMATPAATDGMMWSYSSAERKAAYGPAAADPALSIQCRDAADGKKELVFVRGARAPDGGSGTLSFTGNGTAASIPVRGVTQRAGQTAWQAVVPAGDMARAVGRTFGSNGAVQVGVSQGAGLTVRGASEARTVFLDCLGS